MNHYLLLLKGKGELDYAPDQLQKRLEEYQNWVDGIAEHYISDNRLERRGTHIRHVNDILTDGPFIEAKEIIAGYIILKAKDLEEATKIASTSPLLKYFEIFVRPIIRHE